MNVNSGKRNAYYKLYYAEHRLAKFESNRKHRARNRALLAELKADPCTDCGNTFPSCAMDYDHVSDDKAVNVGNMMQSSWKTILKEVAKCELVCSNCHRIRTETRRLENLLPPA